MGIEGPDGKLSQWPARIVATDASHDLAVLQIDAPPETLQPIKVPNSHAITLIFALCTPLPGGPFRRCTSHTILFLKYA